MGELQMGGSLEQKNQVDRWDGDGTEGGNKGKELGLRDI